MMCYEKQKAQLLINIFVLSVAKVLQSRHWQLPGKQMGEERWLWKADGRQESRQCIWRFSQRSGQRMKESEFIDG